GEGGYGIAEVEVASWVVVGPPSAPSLNVKTPNLASVCDGASVNATFTAGSGGVGCTDTVEFSTNNGGTWSPYTSGTAISTTGSRSEERRVGRDGRTGSAGGA